MGASSQAPIVASSTWEEELKGKLCSLSAALFMNGISAGITDNDSRDKYVTATPCEQDLADTWNSMTYS